MKKKLVLLLIASVMLMSACSNGNGSSADITTTSAENAKEANPADITAAILDKVSMNSAVAKTEENIPDFYSEMDISKVKAASFYICGSGAYPDEISIIELDSSASAEAAKAAVQARLENQIELFETYTPDEMYKLEGAYLYIKGNYVIFLACADNDAAKEIADSMI